MKEPPPETLQVLIPPTRSSNAPLYASLRDLRKLPPSTAPLRWARRDWGHPCKSSVATDGRLRLITSFHAAWVLAHHLLVVFLTKYESQARLR